MAEKWVIRKETLDGIGDAVRALMNFTEEIPVKEIETHLRSLLGEFALPAENMRFTNEPIDPDVMYKIGYNWFAQLVALAQRMAGTSKYMTPAEIVENLSYVIFIPQGRASSDVPNGDFQMSTSTKNPVVVYASAVVELEDHTEPSVTINYVE